MRTRGFTLIELMVVVSIIGLVASMAAPSIQGALTRARAAEQRIVKGGLSSAAKDAFMRNNFKWPAGVTIETGGIGFPSNPEFSFSDLGSGPGTCNVGPPKPWDTSASRESWKWLDYAPEGLLRGRYFFSFDAAGTYDPALCYQVPALSDFDSNGTCAVRITNFCAYGNADWVPENEVVFSSATQSPTEEEEW